MWTHFNFAVHHVVSFGAQNLGHSTRCSLCLLVLHDLLQLVFLLLSPCCVVLGCQCTNVITMGADVGALLVDSGWLFVGLPKVVKVKRVESEDPLNEEPNR